MVNETFERRVLRDMHSSVIVLDNKGMIQYINKPAANKLDISEDITPGTMHYDIDLDNHYNDQFNEYILDAIYQKKEKHTGKVPFMSKSGIRYVFRISASYLENNDYVVITLEDITLETTLNERVHDSSLVFSAFLFMSSLWIIICEFWRYLGAPIPERYLTIGVEIIGAVIFVFILKYTSLTLKDIGLFTSNTKKVVRDGLLISAICVAIMFVLKIVARHFNPMVFKPDRPFFDFDTYKIKAVTYILTAGVQEFLARGVVQSNLERIIVGKHNKGIAIILSGLLFATLHIYYGFFFMMGAAVLAMLEGILYAKQKSLISIWILHYVFGITGMMLGLV